MAIAPCRRAIRTRASRPSEARCWPSAGPTLDPARSRLCRRTMQSAAHLELPCTEAAAGPLAALRAACPHGARAVAALARAAHPTPPGGQRPAEATPRVPPARRRGDGAPRRAPAGADRQDVPVPRQPRRHPAWRSTCETLSLLHDAVPPRPWAEMRPRDRARARRPRRGPVCRVRHAGRSPPRRWRRCTARALHDGTDVAVKVQYPGIERIVRWDLQTIASSPASGRASRR